MASHSTSGSTAHPGLQCAAWGLTIRFLFVRLLPERCILALELVIEVLQTPNLLVAKLQLGFVLEHRGNRRPR
jgi:hypothetical protein